MGSIEQALAATTPYPVELTLRLANLIADLTGTAQDLGAAEGLDLSLTVQAPSISEVLTILAIDLSLRGSARALSKR